jgi:hypothetical protein
MMIVVIITILLVGILISEFLKRINERTYF